MTNPADKFKAAAKLAEALKKLDEKHDRKVRRIESKVENAKLDVGAWLDAERKKLLDAAPADVREMVEALDPL